MCTIWYFSIFFFFQGEDGIRDTSVTGVQTCALPIWQNRFRARATWRDGDGWNVSLDEDRKSVVEGKSVDLGGRRIIKKKKREPKTTVAIAARREHAAPGSTTHGVTEPSSPKTGIGTGRSAHSRVIFFSSRRRHTRYIGDWSSDVCSSDLLQHLAVPGNLKPGGG